MKVKFLIYDLETSGLPVELKGNRKRYESPNILGPYEPARILQVSAILCTYDMELKKWEKKNKKMGNYVVKPMNPEEYDISKETYHINGMTKEYIEKEGKPLKEFLEGGFMFLLDQADYMVGHNILFDLNILVSEVFRLGNEYLANKILHKKYVCTYETAKMKLEMDRYSLSCLYKNLLKEESKYKTHDAENDVMITKKCLGEMLLRDLIDLNEDVKIYYDGVYLKKNGEKIYMKKECPVKKRVKIMEEPKIAKEPIRLEYSRSEPLNLSEERLRSKEWDVIKRNNSKQWVRKMCSYCGLEYKAIRHVPRNHNFGEENYKEYVFSCFPCFDVVYRRDKIPCRVSELSQEEIVHRIFKFFLENGKVPIPEEIDPTCSQVLGCSSESEQVCGYPDKLNQVYLKMMDESKEWLKQKVCN